MLLKTQLIYLRTLKHYNRFLVGLWIARQVTIHPIQESGLTIHSANHKPFNFFSVKITTM